MKVIRKSEIKTESLQERQSQPKAARRAMAALSGLSFHRSRGKGHDKHMAVPNLFLPTTQPISFLSIW